MFKHLLISVVIVPVILGLAAANSSRRRSGLPMLIGLVFAYDLLYVVMLYYLRYRWVD